MPATQFPDELLLNEPQRRGELIQRFYEAHHSENRNIGAAKDDAKKLAFFLEQFQGRGIRVKQGIDLGCRGGVLTKELKQVGEWLGADIDRNAIRMAHENGVSCVQTDISTSLDFRDDAFDAVCLTEVLEHLPYPQVTVSEVHRILRKRDDSVFIGSVPLDYHFHRRFAVLRGKRLTDDPTHLRSFSFQELKNLLSRYFMHVEFAPLRGTKTRLSWLSWHHFVRDIAWFAHSPREHVEFGPIRIDESHA